MFDVSPLILIEEQTTCSLYDNNRACADTLAMVVGLLKIYIFYPVLYCNVDNNFMRGGFGVDIVLSILFFIFVCIVRDDCT